MNILYHRNENEILDHVLSLSESSNFTSEEEFLNHLKESEIQSIEFSNECIEGIFYRTFYLIFRNGEFQLVLNGSNKVNVKSCKVVEYNGNIHYQLKLSLEENKIICDSEFIKYLISRPRNVEYIKQRHLRH